MYKLILMLLLAYPANSQTSNVWNGIIPLKSTRADVEKILGKPEPMSIAKYATGYRVKDGEVFVLYSTGLCNIDPAHGWNIPELTVINVDFSPDYPNPYKFSDLKIDRYKFEMHPDPGSLHLVSYTNEKDGVVLTVDTSSDTIRTFSYFPESKYDCLKCAKVKKQ